MPVILEQLEAYIHGTHSVNELQKTAIKNRLTVWFTDITTRQMVHAVKFAITLVTAHV